MAFINYLFCFLLTAVPLIQGNPASNAVQKYKVELSVSNLNIPQGQSRSVSCTASGDPVPTIQWLKNGADFGNQTIQSENTLSIFDAKTSDAGEYICLGMIGQKVVAQQTLKVEIDATMPTVTVGLRKLTLPVGQNGSVNCEPTGSPRPRVQWSKGKGRFSARVHQNGNTLVLNDVKKSDEGIYVCNAIAEYQAVPICVWSDYVEVEVTDVTVPATIPIPVSTVTETAAPNTPTEPSTVSLAVRTLRVKKGQSGAVDCVAQGYPLPTVQWTKEAGKFGKETRQDGSALIISNAEVSDEGEYICIGLVDGKPVWSEYVYVIVDDTTKTTPPAPASSPRVEVNTPVVKVVKGHWAAVDCNPRGTPTPKVLWSKEHGSFDNRTRVVGNTLIISDAQNEDVGNYICSAVVESTVVWTDYVQVQIVEQDDKVYDTFDVTIVDGHQVPVRCELEFLPVPHNATADDKELVIRIASKKPKGYVCQVSTNYFSLRRAGLSLYAWDPTPPSVIVRPEHKRATIGESVLVECVVVKGEGVSVQWERVNGSLSSRVQARGSTLVFHHIASEDAGDYRCIAKNAGGDVSETTHIEVINAVHEGSSPHDPEVTIAGTLERQVHVRKGQTASIYCVPLGTPLPTVQWKRESGDFRDGVTQEGNWLKITNVTEADKGDYVCDALVEATPVWTDYVRVVVIDECQLPLNTGSFQQRCRSQILRWYYNVTRQRCEYFYYSGCGGNANNFLTFAQCRNTCEAKPSA